jgi:hypothetical protein
MDFMKYIIDEIVVVRTMYTVSLLRYCEALMLLKPSQSLLAPFQSLTFQLPGLRPCTPAQKSHASSRALQKPCHTLLSSHLRLPVPNRCRSKAHTIQQQAELHLGLGAAGHSGCGGSLQRPKGGDRVAGRLQQQRRDQHGACLQVG